MLQNIHLFLNAYLNALKIELKTLYLKLCKK